MLGTIIGDILGHPYESWLLKAESKNIDLCLPMCKITDDSVLTIAISDAVLNEKPYHITLKEWAMKYPNMAYGSGFYEWFNSDTLTIKDSYGDGAAMRISPIAYAFNDLITIKKEVAKSIEYTHNNDEAFIGAYAICLAIFLSRNNNTKEKIKKEIEIQCGYNLNYSVLDVKKWNKHTTRCNVTVPQALICFFESTNYEDCIRNAIYSEGDCDTIAAMAGGIAEAFYKEIPQYLIKFCSYRMPKEFINILENFSSKFPILK